MLAAALDSTYARSLTAYNPQNEYVKKSCTPSLELLKTPLPSDSVVITEGDTKPQDGLKEAALKAGKEQNITAPTGFRPKQLSAEDLEKYNRTVTYGVQQLSDTALVSEYGAMAFVAADIPGPVGTAVASATLNELTKTSLSSAYSYTDVAAVLGNEYVDPCMPGPGEHYPTFEQSRDELKDRIYEFVDEVRGALPTHEHSINQKLDQLLDNMTALTPSNTIAIKKKLRTSLVELRRELSRRSADLQTPGIRRAYEKARNAALDIRWESHTKGYPAAYYRILPPTSSIPNFIELADGVYRGGQADQDGVSILQDHNLRSRIDLRGSDDDNQWFQPTWDNNISHFNIDVEDYKTPTFDQVEDFIRIMDDPANRPLYIHCRAGIGRTGTMVACWRISQGMGAEEAIKRESLNTYEGSLVQQDFIREFEQYWKNKPLATSPAPISA